MEGSFTVTAKGSTLTRSLSFVKEWQEANADADIEIRGGETAAGVKGLLVTLNGKHHPFTIDEARVLAEVVESAVRAFPVEGRDEGLHNLAKGLSDAIRLIQPN